MLEKVHWFLTVDWCKRGKRGVFTNRRGGGFWQSLPHNDDQVYEILGPFFMVLSPKSLPFTEEEAAQVHEWHPLAEYSGMYGYALIPEDVLEAVEQRAEQWLQQKNSTTNSTS
jgi:hypothetical protein